VAPRHRQTSTSSQQQKELRRRRGERAFLFDKDLQQCLGEVDRNDWELAIAVAGGGVADAAAECGIADIQRSGKVLWGTSAEEAVAIYRRWQKRRAG
jgi:hypothetical protein